MKRVEIIETDNRKEWSKKELKRLFPKGDLSHIKEVMFDKYNRYFSMKPYDNFRPRLFKREYEGGLYN